MIASAHSADKKVFEISRMSNEVKELRSAFVDKRGKLMRLKKESYIETWTQYSVGLFGGRLRKFKIDVFTITAARETNCSLLTRKDCVSKEVTGKRG